MERQHPIRGIRFIHKAIRRHVDAIEDLTYEELDLEEEIHDLVDRVEMLARVTQLHTDGEEIGLFPALEARVPNVSATYLFDHHEEARLFDRMREALHDLARAEMDRRGDPLARVRRAAVALAEHIHLHIRKEHKHILPIVEEHFSDDEQREITGKLMAAIPPDDLARTIPWIFQTLDRDERAEYLLAMRGGMPPERFAVVAGWVRDALPVDDWRVLAEQTGL